MVVGRGGGRYAALVAAAVCQHPRELLDGGSRVETSGHHLHLRPLRHVQRHDGRDAARIRLPVTHLQRDCRGEALRKVRQHGRGPGVESGRIRDHDGLGGDCHGPGFGWRRAVALQRDREQRVLAGRHASAGAFARHHPVAVGDDDLGEQALGVCREEVEVERDQRIARVHTVAGLHAWMKSFPLHRHRVDADVHQHFDAFARAQRHRVAGCRQRNDFAVAAGEEHGIGRIDRHAVPDQLLCEDWIGYALERPGLARQRRQNLELVRHLGHPRV